MKRHGAFLNLFILALFLLPVSLLVLNDAALGACATTIRNEAVGAGDTLFRFTTTAGGVDDFFLSDGESNQFLFEDSGVFAVLEDAPEGWSLDSVECTTEGNVPFEVVDGGVQINCPSGMNGIDCTFINIRSQVVTNIPAMSGWGLIATAGGLMAAGVYFSLRRRKTISV